MGVAGSGSCPTAAGTFCGKHARFSCVYGGAAGRLRRKRPGQDAGSLLLAKRAQAKSIEHNDRAHLRGKLWSFQQPTLQIRHVVCVGFRATLAKTNHSNKQNQGKFRPSPVCIW